MGKFKAPSLRNVALTAPYMHDGSIADPRGGDRPLRRRRAQHHRGPAGGRRPRQPVQGPAVSGIDLTAQDKADLVAFLKSLTDLRIKQDPRFKDPFG